MSCKPIINVLSPSFIKLKPSDVQQQEILALVLLQAVKQKSLSSNHPQS
jgi:hypothetical protein